MLIKYYQDELTFLRQIGQEFSRAHPTVASYLADRGSDPDVERLLEGFAFLTARMREKLDDELPELTHTMMGLLWPHYLRPVPAMSIVEFESIPQAIGEYQLVPRGTELDSIPVEGTPCRFRTCYDVDLLPLNLADVILEDSPLRLRLRFKLWDGIPVEKIKLDRIRLYLHGEPAVSYLLYLWLCCSVRRITVQAVHEKRSGKMFTLPPSVIKGVGFDENESLLPYPRHSFAGYRLLQEYFSLPAKFLFLDVTGLQGVTQLEVKDTFDVVMDIAKSSSVIPQVSKDNISLNCTPVVNLLARDADPIRLEHEKVDYLIRPAGSDPLHFEIYSVEQVFGHIQGTAEKRTYEPFFSFKHGLDPSEGMIYYQTRLKPAVVGEGTTSYISFVNASGVGVLPPTETISLELTCTNRRLPGQLRVGDICIPTATSPEFAKFRNITTVSPAFSPPLGGDLPWRLISHLSLNYLSSTSVEALRGILALYNFQILSDRQAARAHELRLEGIRGIESAADDHLFRGALIRGIKTSIELQESHFTSEGDMYLFASVLNEFFALYATLNSFSQLTVKEIEHGEIYRWLPRVGKQILL